jgi:hypothetical protein
MVTRSKAAVGKECEGHVVVGRTRSMPAYPTRVHGSLGCSPHKTSTARVRLFPARAYGCATQANSHALQRPNAT